MASFFVILTDLVSLFANCIVISHVREMIAG